MKTILRNENSEWDGGNDTDPVETQPASQTAPDKTENSTEQKADEKKSPSPIRSPWRMTYVPQLKENHRQIDQTEGDDEVQNETASAPVVGNEEIPLPDTYAELLAESQRLGSMLSHPKWGEISKKEQKAELKQLKNRHEAVKQKLYKIQQLPPITIVDGS